jgi:hypothetical protein
MATGVTDTVWEIADIVRLVEERQNALASNVEGSPEFVIQWWVISLGPFRIAFSAMPNGSFS